MRVQPVSVPYEPDVEAALARVRPPGTDEDITFFRVLARSPRLFDAVLATGEYCISKRNHVSVHDREVVVLRTCARARCEAEWGAHVTMWSERAGLTPEQVAATAADDAVGAPCWSTEEGLLLRFADELHDTATVSDDLWRELATVWSEEQLLDLVFVATTYRMACCLCNATGIGPESWTARFPV